jgi:hypothetical protein
MIIKESPNTLEGLQLQLGHPIGDGGDGSTNLGLSHFNGGLKLKSLHCEDMDFEMMSPSVSKDLVPQRCHSMSVQIIPPSDEPKVTKTTHQLIKTKSMRVRLTFN